MLAERELVREAIVRSWWAVDATDGSRVHEHYSPDGVFQTPAVRLAGAQELDAGHRARHAGRARLSRHLLSNLTIDAERATSRAHYVVTLFSANGAAPQPLTHPQAICDIADTLVLLDGKWLIKERTLQPVFIADDNDSIMLGRSR